jgi:hypothetical protein
MRRSWLCSIYTAGLLRVMYDPVPDGTEHDVTGWFPVDASEIDPGLVTLW